ncbi:glycerophosphoryl diester phosphodiesterase [Arcanobacterium wilhelmae]|uniref:Glycerophosphoryl diester phosphodiesterase n=1 Tax=Arcanobacterium wilhelmae TaxID=1803177 RepID=A0ABT9NC50_9ACTO|nr:glycerophosphodiester phosphodiesterase family protein [Arcanobacterium wilhelmae]MDP9801296.1 glycerophosphoryl diester phosphodiesterase [Arcanobacterium wilhelmae]WFN90641.1 glycerophosphodiester phosphodiesterase family protein [Arcanobacterium wilhelmae]
MAFVIGHRGLSALAPENTLAAFNAALDNGVNWIETDVDVLADGTPILIHDSTLDRTTNRTGRYDPLTAAELNADAGAWFAPEFAGEGVPTLAQLIDLMNERGLNANFELKSNEAGKASTLALVEAVARELERLEPGREVIVSSFNHLLLYLFTQRAPQWAIGLLYEVAINPDWRSTAEIVGARYIHPDHTLLTPENIAQFHAAGLGVNAWTVNDRMRANQLINWGVDGLISNVPHELADLAQR